MYLRFISPFHSRWKNVDYGIFQAAYMCRDEQLIPNYLLDQLMIQVDWFKKHLPSPDELAIEQAKLAKLLQDLPAPSAQYIRYEDIPAPSPEERARFIARLSALIEKMEARAAQDRREWLLSLRDFAP